MRYWRALSDRIVPDHFQMFHGEDEVLASDHEDEIEEDSIDGRCNVVTLPEYLVCVNY